MEDEQRTKLSTPLLGSLVQWSEAPTISSIDWAVVLDQPGSYIYMLCVCLCVCVCVCVSECVLHVHVNHMHVQCTCIQYTT